MQRASSRWAASERSSSGPSLTLFTDGLLLISFSFRVASFVAHGKKADSYELRAFQFLACVAPLIWVQLLKVFDGFVYFGTLTVIILRMFKESAIFFTLLALVMVGFGHAFIALDAADESRVDNVVVKIVDLLTQSILGGADFDLTSEDAFGYPYGHILYYAYCFVTAVILLNILIAFFGTAYSDVVDSADEVYAAFFCQKVVAMVRAPDQFVYLPPFNLLEAFVIAPLEWVVSHETYARINHTVQSVLFSVPLMWIAFYESRKRETEARFGFLCWRTRGGIRRTRGWRAQTMTPLCRKWKEAADCRSHEPSSRILSA